MWLRPCAPASSPMPAMIRDIGYLMRTTAVYGNGKFGIADRALIADRPGLVRALHGRNADRLADPRLHP